MAPACSNPADCARYNNTVYGTVFGCCSGLMLLAAFLFFVLMECGFIKSGKQRAQEKFARWRASSSSSSEHEHRSVAAEDHPLPEFRDPRLPSHMMRWPISREQYEGLDSIGLWKLPPTIPRTPEQRRGHREALAREREQFHALAQRDVRGPPGGLRASPIVPAAFRRAAARTDHTEAAENQDFASSSTLDDNRYTNVGHSEHAVCEQGTQHGSVEFDETSGLLAPPAPTHLRFTDAEESPWLSPIASHLVPMAADRTVVRSPFVPIPRNYTPMPNPFADEVPSVPATPRLLAQHSGNDSGLLPVSKLNVTDLPGPVKTPRQLGRVSLELTPRVLRDGADTYAFQGVEDEAWREDYESLSLSEAERASPLEGLNIKPNDPREDPAIVCHSASVYHSKSSGFSSTKPKGSCDRSLSAGQIEDKTGSSHAVM